MSYNLTMVLVAVLIGLSKGGLGGPVAGSLVLPLLIQHMTVPEASGITLPLLIFADVFAMRFYWRRWDIRYVRLLLPSAVIGIVMGTLLLSSLPDVALRRILGVFTLLIVGYKLLSDRLKRLAYHPRDWHGALAGWGAGVGSSLANAGGPPISAYLLLQKAPPVVFTGTVTLFFFCVNWLKVPGYLTAGIVDVDRLLGIAWVLPLIPVVVAFSRWLITVINQALFERLIMALLVISALWLLGLDSLVR